MERLSQWSIGGRITLIAAVMTVGLIVSGSMGLFASWRISGLFTEYRFGSEQVVAASNIAEDLFEARQAEMLYRREPTEEVAAEVDSNLHEVHDAEAVIEETFLDQPDILELLRMIRHDADDFGTTFDEIIAHQAERDRQVALLVSTGKETREKINSLITTLMFDNNQRAITGLNEGMQSFLLSRIYVERFLLTNDGADFDLASEFMKTARLRLTDAVGTLSSGNRVAAGAEVLDGVEAFWGAFEAAAAAIEARNQVRAHIDDVSTQMADEIEGVVEAIVENQVTLGASSERTLWTVIAMLAGCVLLTVGVAGVFAAVAQRGIS